MPIKLIQITRIQFQHTAARRRLPALQDKITNYFQVSTHSRPKAAAFFDEFINFDTGVSTHSRPKAAACDYLFYLWS